MAKDKFDKAFEDMKAGRIKGPTNDDMSPRQKETLMTKQDIARNQMAAENKDKYLKNYGKGLSDELDTYKTSGKLLEASKSHPWGQGIQEMSDAIRAERTRAGLPTDGMKKGGKVKAKCMASGGKVAQLAKANGIAVKGKSRGRII